MGARVRIPKNELTEFDLPRVCAITGATENVSFFDVSFQFVPRSAVLFYLLCGPLGYIIAMSVMRKTASGKLPFVEQAYRHWRRMAIILPLGLVAVIALAVLVVVLGAQSMSSDTMPIVLGVFGIVLVGGIVGFAVTIRKLGPACIEIDETHITLELPSADAARAFEERLYAKSSEPAPPRADGRDELDDQIDAELKA